MEHYYRYQHEYRHTLRSKGFSGPQADLTYTREYMTLDSFDGKRSMP